MKKKLYCFGDGTGVYAKSKNQAIGLFVNYYISPKLTKAEVRKCCKENFHKENPVIDSWEDFSIMWVEKTKYKGKSKPMQFVYMYL